MSILNKKLNFYFPYLGKITILELIFIVLLITASTWCVVLAMAMLPIFNGVFMPGSGGTAQMLILTLFGPFFICFAAAGLGGIFGFFMFVRMLYEREKLNNKSSENPNKT